MLTAAAVTEAGAVEGSDAGVATGPGPGIGTNSAAIVTEALAEFRLCALVAKMVTVLGAGTMPVRCRGRRW